MNIVEKVSLRNFRCYDEFELDCNRATSLIVGENGRGDIFGIARKIF